MQQLTIFDVANMLKDNTNRKYEDFGPKIGGAKKDRYVTVADLNDMTLKEMSDIKKSDIWKVDYEKMKEEGYDSYGLVFTREVYKNIPKFMYSGNIEDLKDEAVRYVRYLQTVKECTALNKTYGDIFRCKTMIAFNKKMREFREEGIIYDHTYLDTFKLKAALRAVPQVLEGALRGDYCWKYISVDDYMKMEYLILHINSATPRGSNTVDIDTLEKGKMTIFYRGGLKIGDRKIAIYDKGNFQLILKETDEKTLEYYEGLKDFIVKKRSQKKQKIANADPKKMRFKPIVLEKVERDGPDYRHYANVFGDDYMETFGFRAGEFGEWLTQDERRNAMNHGYDALKDLADILDIDDKGISFYGKLAIAFGSRGIPNALAHYEPLRTVINLTKLKGAGCLAHEWFHALDDAIGSHTGSILLASCDPKIKCQPLDDLIFTMKYIQDEKTGALSKTPYLIASEKMDNEFYRSGGYWASNEEMLARAFACYIYDKLEKAGRKSDYLAGMAYMPGAPVPNNEEKGELYPIFDELIKWCKQENII